MPLLVFAQAVFAHRAIRLHVVVAIAALTLSVMLESSAAYLAIALVITVTSYPLVEYGLHRWIMQARFWWRFEFTATAWRRVHYDHHRNPRDLTVLFADPVMSVPFLLLLSAFASVIAQEARLFPAMIFCSFLAFIYYELMHAAAHMRVRSRNRWLARRRQDHLRHHHVDEQRYLGVGTGLVDRLVDTVSRSRGKCRPSPTVYNLGYDETMMARFPWVAEGYARKLSTQDSPVD